MNTPILAGLALAATLGLSAAAFANEPGSNNQGAPGSGQSATATCNNNSCLHVTKHRPKPGTGGYESPGYGNDGGGFRIKVQGGVQHVPPSQPVAPAQTQAGGS